jgi:hypothetical protein
MRFSLMTLLIGATVFPPMLAGGWFASSHIIRMLDHTNWHDFQPFVNQAAAMAGLIASLTIVGALCQRLGSGAWPGN